MNDPKINKIHRVPKNQTDTFVINYGQLSLYDTVRVYYQ